MVDYYARVGPTMVPHLNGRAVTLRRFPEGVDDLDSAFFEKRCPKHRPKWVKTASVRAGPDAGQDRLLRLRQPPDPGLDGAAGGDRAAPLALALAGAEPADRPRLRPRSRTAGRRRRVLPGRAPAARPVRPLRDRGLPEDVGLEGPPGLRPAQPQGRQLRGDETVRESDRPAARKGDPRRGGLEDEKGRPPGQGLRRLVAEPPQQNDDLGLLDARPRTADGLDPGQLGGGRARRRERRRRLARLRGRRRCWSGSRSTATSSPRSSSSNRPCPSSE